MITLSRDASAARLLLDLTSLSVNDPTRDRCVRPPSPNVLWMCITLLFLEQMINAASEMEPAASDVTRVVACPASSSMRAASCEYSNF